MMVDRLIRMAPTAGHLETHVADAIIAGRGAEIVDELMEALKYDKRVLRPTPDDPTPAPSM